MGACTGSPGWGKKTPSGGSERSAGSRFEAHKLSNAGKGKEEGGGGECHPRESVTSLTAWRDSYQKKKKNKNPAGAYSKRKGESIFCAAFTPLFGSWGITVTVTLDR